MNQENQQTMQPTALQVDSLIFRAENSHEVTDDQTKALTIELFQKLQSIAVCGDDERRELWLTAPRGSYQKRQKWYLLTTVVYKEIHSVFIGGKLVLQFQPEPQGQYPYDKSELADWLLIAVDKAITSLKEGEYNEYVRKNLPYRKRIGKILREDYWCIFPKEKEEFLSDIEADEIARFAELINDQPADSPVLRLKEMTAELFFDCCRFGYEANRYEGIDKLTPKEMYRAHADGRDEGISNLDESSGKAFDTWFHDKTHSGGHPWEVCRGGNSTHISLYPHHDEKGWWLTLAGSSQGRSVETVKFYLALVDHGLPVFLIDGRKIADMLEGKDYIGIVPEGIIPRYCTSLFPGEEMLTFMNLPWEEAKKVQRAAVWYPNKIVRLS